MGVELAAAAEVPAHLRHRKPLAIKEALAGNPGAPKWAVQVTSASGKSVAVADPVITRTMLSLMNMDAVMGGAACHWGGPAALAELMSSIHGILFAAPDHRLAYNFINDAGHTENGLYALKANYGFAGVTVKDLRGFRSITSKLTGHGESHLFPEGVMVSNGPLGSSLPVAQGLAMADRTADNDRTTICVISDGAMMEGEAKEAVAAIPGLAGKNLLNPFVLVISDNNTKLSGRVDEDAFSMHPYFNSLAAQGWTIVRCEKGNDLQSAFTAVETAVARVKADRTKPVVVWATTIKGFGVASTVKSSSGGHGYPISKGDAVRVFAEEAYGKKLDGEWATWCSDLEKIWADKQAKAAAKPANPNAPKTNKIQAGFPVAMIAAADKGLPVISISADLQGSTGVAPFRTKYPQFSPEVGVAESNMISSAAGYSRLGYIPVVDTFVQFGVTKGALPMCMANISQSPIIAVFTHTGFQDAADGASHQGLMYLAMSGAIPHLTQYCPASAEEAEWAMGAAIDMFATQRPAGKTPDSVLFFCGRENFPVSIKPAGAQYAWCKAMTVADTSADAKNTVVISANGAMVALAIKAAETLKAAGIGAIVLNNATPNKPDLDAHKAALAKAGGRLVTVEDHQKVGGAGAMLTAALGDAGVTVTKMTILGVNGEFGQSAYTAGELYDKHGIGHDGIVAAVKKVV